MTLKLAVIIPFLLLPAACATSRPSDSALSLAITIDDLPIHGPSPLNATPQATADRMIRIFKQAEIPAVGFINGQWTEREPGSVTILQSWNRAGLQLANHGWSHRHLNEMALAEFEQEVARNEPLLKRFSGDWRWFRYPFLDEGETPEKRAAARQILARRGYRVAAVTMDFSDWAWTAPYARCVEQDDDGAIAGLEVAYLDAARESVAYYRTLSRRLYGRDIPYVLLLHASEFTSRLLPQLLEIYRREGFRFATLNEVQRDPAYADQNRLDLPAGPQGLEGKAAARQFPLAPRTSYTAMLDSICRPAAASAR